MTTLQLLTKKHQLPNGSVEILGATDSVTPSCTLVTMNSKKILVDCGVTNGETIDVKALSAQTLILTHGHYDHAGGLPELLAAGRISSIFATPATMEITKTLVKDSIYLNGGSNVDYLRFKDNLKRVTRTVSYGEKFIPIKNSDLECTLYEAGHIIGSSSLDISSPESRIIISGDLGRPSSPLLKDYFTDWDKDKDVDLVLVESTYGGRTHNLDPAQVELQLETIIKDAMESGGHILIPAFAIGRTQNILYMLNNLVEQGRIKDLPVAVDTPMGLSVINTYKKFKKLYDKESLEKIDKGDDPIDFDNLYRVRRSRDSARLDSIDSTMLIIAGSGMCTGGRIARHLVNLLDKPETTVVFAGYQAKGTPGATLQQLESDETSTKEITLYDIPITVRATIKTLHGISAHADQNELTRWLAAIPNVKSIALYHGDEDSQQAFADHLKSTILKPV